MILIRADANENIGIGHVMRCLSIAKAIEALGEKVVFVTADHNPDKLLEKYGFEVISLDSSWDDPEAHVTKLIELIKKRGPRLMLIDSYYVSEEYFKILRKYTRIAYMDDLNAERWCVDYLINYNIYAETFDYSWYNETDTKLLLGPRYTPLRDEFKDVSTHNINAMITDVLVSTGGADPVGIAKTILKDICPTFMDIRFHFVVGSMNKKMESFHFENYKNVMLHINETHMSKLMMKCDVAIAAAGSTLYELCACGIPTITYALADNQLEAIKEFAKRDIMISVGDCRVNDSFSDDMRKALQVMIEQVNIRKNSSVKMQTLIDGDGAQRLAELIS